MHRASSTSRLEILLPFAADWAAEQEQRILRDGVELSEQQTSYAKLAGVKEPERVRLLHVEAIPAPTHPLLSAAYSAINLPGATPRGLTLGYGIFIRADCAEDRHLLIHELAHTSQYERFGGIVPFLKKYLLECFTLGYRSSPLELEANSLATRIFPV